MELLNRFCDRVRELVQTYIVSPIRQMRIIDAVDILLLAFVLYLLYAYFRRRRAARVFAGLAVVVVFSLLVTLFKLPTLTYIVRLFAGAAFFGIIVIFQPEIRDALEKLGNAPVFHPGKGLLTRRQYQMASDVTAETVDAVMKMSESCTGALIVFEGLTGLGESLEVGKYIDAKVTSSLLQNLFYDKAPLHDGAVIIRSMRIHSASCVLPSAHGKMNFGTMGTRHRAAVGISEVSDALVVVVSEETGIVSVAEDGKLVRRVDREELTDLLMTYLAGRSYLRRKKAERRAAEEKAAEQQKEDPEAPAKDPYAMYMDESEPADEKDRTIGEQLTIDGVRENGELSEESKDESDSRGGEV